MLEVGRLTVYSRIKVSSMIAGTQVTSNIPIAWFLVLGCNRQAQIAKREREEHPNIGLQLHYPVNFLFGEADDGEVVAETKRRERQER